VGPSPGLELAPLGWCVVAMQRAVERVRVIGWNDVVGQYAAVSETLFWVDIVEAQLRKRYRQHYDDALNAQCQDLRPAIRGLLWARNRIKHEVDQVGYLLASLKSPDDFTAAWTWRSLPPRPPGPREDRSGYAAYESAVAGRNVVEVLLEVIICLAQLHSRMLATQ
jgi:hypothetical protein